MDSTHSRIHLFDMVLYTVKTTLQRANYFTHLYITVYIFTNLYDAIYRVGRKSKLLYIVGCNVVSYGPI